jgi:ribosome-associated toxin RatA of RatAB toxin-antitoxin module
MQRQIQQFVGASVDMVTDVVADVAMYPSWITAVAETTAVDDDRTAVVISGRLGPFTRSKRLVMRTTVASNDSGRTVTVCRDEGPGHGSWTLSWRMTPDSEGTNVLATLEYDGRWWIPEQLGRVLDAVVDDARNGLISEVARRDAR